MLDSNPLFNSSNSLSQISSIRESLRFTPVKPTKPITEDSYYHHNSSNKVDVNHNTRTIDLLNDLINLENYNRSSLNSSLHQKKAQIGDQVIQMQNKRNSSQSKLTDSNQKFLTKTHSAVDLTSTSINLINKHELSYIKESIEDVRDKIIKLTIEKENNASGLTQITAEMKRIKEKKRMINEQIENKLSQRESFEEIYRFNISKYSKQYKPSSNSIRLSPCYSDNIIISKEEVRSLSITQYKEVIVAILNDLFDSKTELIYYNLIEAIIAKTYPALNSFSGPSKAEVFFLKLSKAICDIYPIINNDALIILLKYAVKLRYIDNIIQQDMYFTSKEYKSKKREYKGMLKDINETLPKCDLKIAEAKEKEKELLMKLEAIRNNNSIGLDKDYERSKMHECNCDFRTIDDQNIGFNSRLYNGINANNSNWLSSLVSEKQNAENKSDTNLRFSNRKSNGRVEEVNANNTNIFQMNNNYSETKSTFHRSASNTGSAFMKNETSSLLLILDDKNNQSYLSKSPPKVGRNPQSYNSNHFNCSSIRKKNLENNLTNVIFKQKSSPIKQSDNRCQFNNRLTKMLSNSKFNKEDKEDKAEEVNPNVDVNGSNKHLVRSVSSMSIQPKQHLQSSNFPVLNNTYCYYKFLIKYDPKYNPLLSQSTSPKHLGYEKGFASFSPVQMQITISPSWNSMSNQSQIIIPIKEIKNTIVLNSIKDISYLHRSYQRMLISNHNAPIDINEFIRRDEFRKINLSDNDKIKSVLCSFFSFSLLMKDNAIIELIFVSYNEFKTWLNGLGNILNSN